MLYGKICSLVVNGQSFLGYRRLSVKSLSLFANQQKGFGVGGRIILCYSTVEQERKRQGLNGEEFCSFKTVDHFYVIKKKSCKEYDLRIKERFIIERDTNVAFYLTVILFCSTFVSFNFSGFHLGVEQITRQPLLLDSSSQKALLQCPEMQVREGRMSMNLPTRALVNKWSAVEHSSTGGFLSVQRLLMALPWILTGSL